MLTQGTKVLITGGAGFLGSHVARALAASGCEVRVLDDLSTGKRERIASLAGIELLQGDVRNPAAVNRAMQGVEAVVHLAGVQPGVDPIRAQDINLGGALHILNCAREMGADGKRIAGPARRPRVVLCGSASVYGKQTGFVLHEELTPRPMTPEAVMALAMEQYGRVYRESYGVPVVNLRIFRVFGPDEDPDRGDAGIVAKLVKAALDGKAPVLFGDGQQTRDLIHVDNVVAAVMAALQSEDPPAEPLNIASGEAVAINFLWNLVLECCGKRRLAIDPTYIPAPPWEAKHSRPQIARACKVLGWAPAVRLREGLQKTVEHYQSLRNADPNAWFTPKDEPAPKRPKSTFPQVSVPTRRFGSVVTPAFGTPIMGGSQAGPLPRAGSVAGPLPRSSSVSAPLPRPGSVAGPLPRRSSVSAPLPRASSVSAPLPRPGSVAAPLPRSSSVSAPLPRSNSVSAPLPRSSSVSAPLPRSSSVSAPLPRPGSVAAPLPRSTTGNTPPPMPISAPAKAKPKAKNEEIVEVSADDLVEDQPNGEIDLDDLKFEWAPVPSVPGMGR